MDYGKYELNQVEKVKCGIIAGGACTLLFLLFYGKTLFCFTGLVCGIAVRVPYAKYLARKRKDMLKLQFRDLLYSLSASIAAGRHMKTALEEGVVNLNILYASKRYLAIELSGIIAKIECSHQSEQELLCDFARRSSIEDIQAFFNVYYICLRTGGDLVSVIRKAGDVLLDKMTIEHDINSYTAQKRFEGRLIAVMPLLIIFFLNMVSPGYLSPMYGTLAGKIIMTGCLLAMVFAFALAEKIMNIPINSGNVADELPDFINKIVLLMNAGLVLTAAFDTIVSERREEKEKFYQKLREINNNLKCSNSSFPLEFRKYAVEVGERQILRLSNVINDGIDKGSELTIKLEKESELMWHMMKKSAEEKGRIAESKLSFPMGIMMLVLITVTTAPALMTI